MVILIVGKMTGNKETPPIAWKIEWNMLPITRFFQKEQNIYLHFVSFLHIDMTRVVEILPQVRPELA